MKPKIILALTLIACSTHTCIGAESNESTSNTHSDKYVIHLGKSPSVVETPGTISMVIKSVTPRLKIGDFKQSFEDADAAILLTFKSTSDSGASLPLWQSSGGKASRQLLKNYSPMVQLKANKVPSEFGCEFASLRYSWRNPSGSVVSTGTKCLCAENVEIPPNGEGYFAAPIRLPSTIGKFELSVEFDNRNLETASQGYNNRLINRRIGELRPWTYVTLTTACNVEITSEVSLRQMFEGSESVTVCRYKNLQSIYRENSAPPVGLFQIEEYLKGPPFSTFLPIQFGNGSGTTEVASKHKFSTTNIPEKGSKWIIAIPNAVPVNGCFETFNGSEGIIEATDENLRSFQEIARMNLPTH